MLVLRDAFRGLSRFSQFERSLGVPKKVLADRLERLVVEELLERSRYQENPPRDEYVLTDKGRGLWRAMAHLLLWGEEHYPAEGGPPRVIEHVGCGGTADERLRCTSCGAELELGAVQLASGPALLSAGAGSR
jgi:DNA-binding HxlR family transcriptional regulator